MLTWFLLGYLALSLLTFLFSYGAYVAAARADAAQGQPKTHYTVAYRPTQSMTMPGDTLSLSTT